jgi:hypothetical protein
VTAAVFARHLDLAPLRGRTKGKVRCLFHEEKTASLSLDLDRGLFHCFGCGVQGGVVAFARLVGEVPTASSTETSEQAAERLARSQPWFHEHVWLSYKLADWVRCTQRAVIEARQAPDSWDALARAAELETLSYMIEATLDA